LFIADKVLNKRRNTINLHNVNTTATREQHFLKF